jgi:hypothetical protein
MIDVLEKNYVTAGPCSIQALSIAREVSRFFANLDYHPHNIVVSAQRYGLGGDLDIFASSDVVPDSFVEQVVDPLLEDPAVRSGRVSLDALEALIVRRMCQVDHLLFPLLYQMYYNSACIVTSTELVFLAPVNVPMDVKVDVIQRRYALQPAPLRD